VKSWVSPENEKKEAEERRAILFLYIDCVHCITRRKRCMRAFLFFLQLPAGWPADQTAAGQKKFVEHFGVSIIESVHRSWTWDCKLWTKLLD
jgi:hypothetical protein